MILALWILVSLCLALLWALHRRTEECARLRDALWRYDPRRTDID